MTAVRDQSEPGCQSEPAVQDKPHKPIPAVITRLAMAGDTWAHWDIPPAALPEHRSSARHRALLNTLLRKPLPGSSGASEPGRPVPQPEVEILFEPQRDEFNRIAYNSSDRISYDPLLVRPRDWFEEHFDKDWKKFSTDCDDTGDNIDLDKRINFVIKGLEQCELTAHRAKLRRASQLLVAQMNLFACRLYLSPERAAGLIRGLRSKNFTALGYVVIDLRFREHFGRYWLYATFTAYTYQPKMPGLLSEDRSESVQYPGDDSSESRADNFTSVFTDGLETLRHQYWRNLLRGFQDRVHAFFPATQMIILGREYRPPWFWVATGRDFTTTSAVSPNGHVVRQHDLLRTLLDVPGPDTTGLGIGDINGRARMFRRFVPSPHLQRGYDRPVYLILPFASSVGSEDDRQNEDDWRKMIQKLSDLEADAATQLFDIITDIDIYSSQLNLYEKIGTAGLALWDQIALFLPVERRTRLSKAHRLIELIHQIVLQSFADLEEEAANAEHTIDRVNAVAHDLINQFDREFAEQPVPGHPTIRDSLTRVGYFDKARHAAQSVHEQSRQVRSTYKAILDSMTYAFDERRARETDVLQLVALFFAIVLGVVSIWNEFRNRYINDWRDVGRWVGSGAVLIVLTIVVVLVNQSRRSRLTSRKFDKHFKELQKLLAAYSSDRLTRLRTADEELALDSLSDDEKESQNGKIATKAQDSVFWRTAERWRLFDLGLAKRVAKILDSFPEPPKEPEGIQGLPKIRLEEVRKRVEAWALRALLVTERPRTFHSSALPLLTFLYRFFPIISGKPSRESDWSAAESQVSDYDFRLTVVNHCGCQPKNIPTLIRWGHRKVREEQQGSEPESISMPIRLVHRLIPRKARCPNHVSKFVEELQEIGVSWHEGLRKVDICRHMTNERFRIMMSKMNQSFWDPNNFDYWDKDATRDLRAAKEMNSNEFAETICKMAKGSAQLELIAYLYAVGARAEKGWDLIRLGVEVRATAGQLPVHTQDAIWRLSAYEDPETQYSTHPMGRTPSRVYGEPDPEKALDDADKVFEFVNSQKPAAEV